MSHLLDCALNKILLLTGNSVALILGLLLWLGLATTGWCEPDYVAIQYRASIILQVNSNATPSATVSFADDQFAIGGPVCNSQLCTVTIDTGLRSAHLKVSGTVNPPQYQFVIYPGVTTSVRGGTQVMFSNAPACQALYLENDSCSAPGAGIDWEIDYGLYTVLHKEDTSQATGFCIQLIKAIGTIQFDACETDGVPALVADGKSTAKAWLSELGTMVPPISWSIVGDPLGCSIESQTVTNANGVVTSFARITAGKTNGTITARAADSRICFVEAKLDLSGCSGCSQNTCQAFASGELGTEREQLALSMGKSRFGSWAGALQIREDAASDRLYSPAALRFNYKRDDVIVVYDENQAIRQVKAPQGLADVVVTDTNLYQCEVRFYHDTAVGAKGPEGFDVSGEPFVVWRLAKPSEESTNRLQVTEVWGTGTTNEHQLTWLTNGVEASIAGGLRVERKTISWPTNDVRRESVQISQGTNEPVAVSSKTYTLLASGERLTEEVKGSGSSALTNSYSYDTNGWLQQAVRADGSWNQYVYDAAGRPIRIYSSFLNVQPTTNASTCRLTEYDYSTNAVPGSGDIAWIEPTSPRRTAESVLGQPVAISYRVHLLGETRDIRCSDAGTDWNSEGTLVTTNRSYTNGQFYGKPLSVLHPDGTAQIFKYYASEPPTSYGVTLIDNLTNVVFSGQPDTSQTGLLDGTKTVTIVGPVGQVYSQETTDVRSQPPIITARSTYGDFDEFVRAQSQTNLDGRVIQKQYCASCGCGPTSVTGPEGSTTSYQYDPLKRLRTTTQDGITTSNVLDAAGNVLATIRVGRDSTQIVISTNTYDTAGRQLTSTDALGNQTTYSEALAPVTRTTTLPNGGTRIESHARDGTLLKMSGTAVQSARYTNGIASDEGTDRFHTAEIRLDASGNETGECTTNYVDLLGRTYKTVRAGGATSLVSWNALGQLAQEVDPDGVSTTNLYNAKGERECTIVDMNRDDVIDWAGSDRITRTETVVTNNGMADVRRTCTYIWPSSTSFASNLSSTVEVSVDGLHTWHTNFGQVSQSHTYFAGSGVRYVTNTAPDGTFTIQQFENGRLVSAETRNPELGVLNSATYAYDAHNRQSTNTDARAGSTVFTYDAADRLTSVTTPNPGIGSQVTSNTYNNMGWITSVKLPDGQTVTKEYYTNGLLKKTYGARTYPVEYTYDYAGRLKTMKTWQSYAGSSGAAATTWNYDTNQGFLISKVYDGGTGTIFYTNTAAGRLKNRIGGRGIKATYGHNYAGDLISINYSDGTTPYVVYGLDRRGRRTLVVSGTQARSYLAYDNAGNLLSEYWSNGPLNGLALTNSYDGLQRRTNLAVYSGSSLLTSNSYSYDSASRLSSVSDGTHSAEYSYLTNSSLATNIVLKNGGVERMKTTRFYDALNRLTSIVSSNNAAGVVSSHAYAYNSANQRTKATREDSAYWVYAYDALGQVTSGKKYWSDGTPVAGQQFEYAFDDIGNRKSAAGGGDQWGANLRYEDYTANNLNQYTSRTVPGSLDVLGAANSNATVTILTDSNGIAAPFPGARPGIYPTIRKGEYFRGEMWFNNATGAVYSALTNLGVLANGTNADIATTNSGYVLLPKTPEGYSYDADGNLTNSGLWGMTWDAENRPTATESSSGVASSARQGEQWTYLPDGRWIQRIVSTWNGSAYSPTSTNRFVWDGAVLLAILDQTNGLVMSFLRGLDLGGTPKGAGGVGGVVAITVKTNATHFFAYDGNGNVMALVSATNGTLSAQYEYDPFGKTLRSTGPVAKANPIRFSSQYTDDVTGHMKYLYREYDPPTGKWPSRDPINEPGFKILTSRPRRPFYKDEENALYGFVGNNPVGRIDFLGLYTASVGKCEVVVLYGHGSSSHPHKFKFAVCSAGHFVGCESKATNDKIPSENQIPGAPSTEEELYSGPGNRDNPDQSFDLFMDNSWEAAKKKAKAICAKKDCCCKSVTVRTELAGSAWNPDNWTFPGTKSETIKCDGK